MCAGDSSTRTMPMSKPLARAISIEGPISKDRTPDYVQLLLAS